MSAGRILFIDAYDSFSNNIVSLLRSELAISVETIEIDDSRFVLNDDAFYSFLDGFDAVVAGPGPGHPENTTDTGLIGQLWTLPDENSVPVLGICLAFQSLALAFGATVDRLQEPRHGMVTQVLHCGNDIFENAEETVATQYHSLHVRLDDEIHRTTSRNLWRPSKFSKELIPLAWDLSDERNGPVLMGVRHCHKPFWGVQYHPESICTNEEGQKLIASWWSHACAWRASHARSRFGIPKCLTNNATRAKHCALEGEGSQLSKQLVQWRSLQPQEILDMTDVVNVFRSDCAHQQPILLESGIRNGRPVNPETGRFSIIGLPDAQSIHIRYFMNERRLTVSAPTGVIAEWDSNISDAFAFLEIFVEKQKVDGGSSGLPFWGGLIGFVSYEAGLDTINVKPASPAEYQPDIWFVFIERSIVLDHSTSKLYLQSIRDEDLDWLCSTEQRLIQLKTMDMLPPSNIEQVGPAGKLVYSPEEVLYCRKVKICQHHLRAGSSYELCLTDTTLISSERDPWQLYGRLRKLNPAPFGAYFNVAAPSTEQYSDAQELHLLSSSPERFLSWSRDGKCQFRPIKGTVKKGPDMTREKAESILNSPKERAENLMIVDLIRHDLNGVESGHNVQVPKLMSVEEYESVFQLVSVIEGDINGSGIPVLAASLPPGSMTGAPKKRSCDLLQEIEKGTPRGLYSGVFGYLDVGGGGDFSVVIRSAFKWNDEDWRIGAGGAVTALSDAEAEWQEMLAKRENVLHAFS